MYPPLFVTLNASSAVKAIFGTSPLRVWPFGQALQKGATGYGKPYATFQTISGSPENYLNQVPDIDSFTEQVDVYADTPTAARAGAQAIRDAIEPVAYIVGWRGEYFEKETDLYRYSFDIDWLTPR